MKKRAWAALLAAVLSLSLLSGCGGNKGAETGTPAPTQSARPSTKLDKPPQPEQILSDVNAFSPSVMPDGIRATSCEVIKRQSNPEQKEDIVFCKIIAENGFFLGNYEFKLLYNFYDEGGWVLDTLTPEHEEQWTQNYYGSDGLSVKDGLIIPEHSYYIENFVDGYAVARQYGNGTDCFGLIDTQGREVLPCQFPRLRISSIENLLIVSSQEGEYLMDMNGTRQSASYTDIINSGNITDDSGTVIDTYYNVLQGELLGMINAQGSEVISPRYGKSSAHNFFTENRCPVQDPVTGLWGYISPDGQEVIPLQFDYAARFYNGYAAVEQNDKWGLIDKQGQIILPIQYDDISDWEEGRVYVEQDGVGGFVDFNGKSLGPTTAGHRNFLSGEYSTVKQNDLFAIFSEDGTQITPYTYDYVSTFPGIDQMWFIVRKDKKFSVLDSSGNVRLENLDSAINTRGGLLYVRVGGAYAFYDYALRRRTPDFQAPQDWEEFINYEPYEDLSRTYNFSSGVTALRSEDGTHKDVILKTPLTQEEVTQYEMARKMWQ